MIGSHVIPRYYLEQFATKKKRNAKTGHLWVYSTSSPPRQGTAKSEGVENGYFGLPTPEGDLDEALEQKLATLENEANHVLIMAPNQTFVWSSSSRRVLATYAGLLYARTKARRDATAWVAATSSRDVLRLVEDDKFIQEMAEHYTNLAGQPVEPSDVREPLKRAAEEIATPEGKRTLFIGEVLDTIKLISEIYLQRPWQVWRTPDTTI